MVSDFVVEFVQPNGSLTRRDCPNSQNRESVSPKICKLLQFIYANTRQDEYFPDVAGSSGYKVEMTQTPFNNSKKITQSVSSVVVTETSQSGTLIPAVVLPGLFITA